MDKDYLKERSYIEGRASLFYNYLDEDVLGNHAVRLMKAVASQTDVYIFSGVIRNFLLGFTENRDVDVVIVNIKSLSLSKEMLEGCKIRRNSFGGFKIMIENLTIDAWGIESTWGLLLKNMRLTPNSLIRTAFFNFSAIAYDYNKKRFYYGDEVCHFLRTRAIDVVFPENPNKALCILNTIYYAKKYKFPIAYSLCKWIFQNYEESMPFDDVMQKHFSGNVITDDQRVWFMKVIRNAVAHGFMKHNHCLYLDFIQRRVSLIEE